MNATRFGVATVSCRNWHCSRYDIDKLLEFVIYIYVKSGKPMWTLASVWERFAVRLEQYLRTYATWDIHHERMMIEHFLSVGDSDINLTNTERRFTSWKVKRSQKTFFFVSNLFLFQGNELKKFDRFLKSPKSFEPSRTNTSVTRDSARP